MREDALEALRHWLSQGPTRLEGYLEACPDAYTVRKSLKIELEHAALALQRTPVPKKPVAKKTKTKKKKKKKKKKG